MKRSIRKFLVVACALSTLISTLILPANAYEAVAGHYRGEKAIEPTVSLIQVKETIVEEIPQYFQNDYPDIKYGGGTVKTSGCGITCAAMIATYMLDDTSLTPDVLAIEYGSRGGGNLKRMEIACEELGLTWEKEFDWPDVMDALREGKVAIALVNSGSNFTTSQHFITFSGITENGKVMVVDPNYQNVRKMSNWFKNGFSQSEIECGFEGAWIFEKEA